MFAALFICGTLCGCGCSHEMQKEIITEKTCVTNGVIRHYCTKCDYSYEETLKSDGQHDFDDGTVIKEATCREDGICEYQCRVCGEKEEEAIPAQHIFSDDTVIQEATCRENGKQRRSCSVCGYEETVDIEAAGHTFVDNICTKCHAYKAPIEFCSDSWYTYTDLDILHVQNCMVADAFVRNTGGVCATYYPICKKCDILSNLPAIATVSFNSPVAKEYYCDECGASTLVQLEVE